MCHSNLPTRQVFHRFILDFLHSMLGKFLLSLWSLYVYLQTRILHFRINLPPMLGQLQLRGRGALLYLQ